MYNLPPLINISPSVRKSKKYKQAVLDALEQIGMQQYLENLDKFQDFYDMYDGTLSSRELREIMPQNDEVLHLLGEAEIPTYIRHYDFLGSLINNLVGKLSDMKEKFHVIDSGEVAENEFLDYKKEEIKKIAEESIKKAIDLAKAKAGINPQTQQEFQSEEEQQQYIQQMQAFEQEFTPKLLQAIQKFPNFKTLGVQWGEHIIDRDKTAMNMDDQYQELFKHYLITGMCAKITKVFYDTYKTYVWDSREVFHSKDIGEKLLNKYEFVGRFHYKTPSQVVEEYGHKMSEKDKIKLLSSGKKWGEFFNNTFSGLEHSPKQAMSMHFHNKYLVPTQDYFYRKKFEKIEDHTGVPMGVRYIPNFEEGGWNTEPTFIPRHRYGGANSALAQHVERRFEVREDVCQITEAYVRVYEKVGWLTYEDEFGDVVREMVTEDILPEFLKENGITQTITQSFEEVLTEEPKLNTLVWLSMPFYYEAIKISGGYLEEPLYVCFNKLENQITDLSTFETRCPVSGIISNSVASKLAPYQEMFNLAMNGMRQIAETDVGMFFMTDIMNIPSEYTQNGENVEEALVQMRNMAKRTKLLPVQTNPDNMSGGQSVFNQYQAYNLSDFQGIQWRLQVADRFKMEGYSQIGLNPQMALQPTKYTNEEGIKLSNDSMNDQLANIFNTFNLFIKEDLIQHLNVSHWMQSNNMDKTIFYTNSYGHKMFLDVSQDEKFSARRLGLIPSDDSRKRKELETLKQYMVSQNTMGGDTLSLAKVLFSDSVSELLQIANEERSIAEERAQIEHERQMQQNEQISKLQEEAALKDYERKEASNEKERENKIRVAEIKAMGDMLDNGATPDQVTILNERARMSLEATKAENARIAKERELDIREAELQIKKQQAQQGFVTEAQRLQHQKEMKDKDIQIAAMNKN